MQLQKSALDIKFFDDVRFVLNVAVNVIGIQCGGILLDPAVGLGGFAMTAQIIPEGDVTLQFRRIFRTDIQMVFLQVRFVFVAKGFPAGNTQIPFVDITDACQLFQLSLSVAVLGQQIDQVREVGGIALYR